jgi:hypothetical protein
MGFGPLNTAYITLILKKEDANQPKDFKVNGETSLFAAANSVFKSKRVYKWSFHTK